MAEPISELQQVTDQPKAMVLDAKAAFLKRPEGPGPVFAAGPVAPQPIRCGWGDLGKLMRWLASLRQLEVSLVREHQSGGDVSALQFVGSLKPEAVVHEIKGDFLIQMEDEGVPAEVSAKLGALRGQAFTGLFGAAEFADAVKALIGTDLWQQHSAAIVRNARKDTESIEWRYAEPARPSTDTWPSLAFLSGEISGFQDSKTKADVDAFRRNARNYIDLFTEVLAQLVPEWWTPVAAHFARIGQWVDGWRDEPDTFRWAVLPEAPPSKSDDLARVSLQIDVDLDEKLRKLLAAGRICTFATLRIHFHTDSPKALGDGDEVLPVPGELPEAFTRIATLTEAALEPLRLRITGHTDQRQSHDYNQALSNRRAQWVLKRLRERFPSFPFQEVDVLGMGEALASGPRDNPADRYCEVAVEPTAAP